MLETRENSIRARNMRRHGGRNKKGRESLATKRSTYRRNTHHRSRATGQHCIHAMTVRVRKSAPPIGARPTRSDQRRTRVSGASSTPQSQLPNARHSHADPDRQRHVPPNPARPRPRKTHERHPKLGKPLYLSSSSTNHTPPMRSAGTKNARTPHTRVRTRR